jgi:hypothetical protein
MPALRRNQPTRSALAIGRLVSLGFRPDNCRRFMPTGRLETTNGIALSTVLDDPSDAMSVVRLEPDAPPGAGEVFDGHS